MGSFYRIYSRHRQKIETVVVDRELARVLVFESANHEKEHYGVPYHTVAK